MSNKGWWGLGKAVVTRKCPSDVQVECPPPIPCTQQIFSGSHSQSCHFQLVLQKADIVPALRTVLGVEEATDGEMQKRQKGRRLSKLGSQISPETSINTYKTSQDFASQIVYIKRGREDQLLNIRQNFWNRSAHRRVDNWVFPFS